MISKADRALQLHDEGLSTAVIGERLGATVPEVHSMLHRARKKVPPVPLLVTDHAVLRYLERVKGLDVESIRLHILALCAGPAALQATCVRAEGHRFEIHNNKVVTVTPGNVAPGRTGRAISQERIKR